MQNSKHNTRIIGESPALLKTKKEAAQIAKSNAPVLLIGETGTGKELFADLIHFSSTRRVSPLVKVNCAAIQDSLLESELFGHEKGSFTGASSKKLGKLHTADTGTLFLDEVANMSLPIQAKVLRAVETQRFEPVGGNSTVKVDIRIISASNQELEHLIYDNQFRKDLYYRLGVLILRIPPLRERGEDIILLAQHFAKVFKAKYNKNISSITETATKDLMSYSWPGNVRELHHIIERAVLFCETDTISRNHINIKTPYNDPELEKAHAAESGHLMTYTVDKLRTNGYKGKMEKALREMEVIWIKKALHDTKLVQKEAARTLGISSRKLCYKLKTYNIDNISPYRDKMLPMTQAALKSRKTRKEKGHGIQTV